MGEVMVCSLCQDEIAGDRKMHEKFWLKLDLFVSHKPNGSGVREVWRCT